MPEPVRDVQQRDRHGQVAHEFADQHVHHAGPEWQVQPAGQRAQRVADDRQPGQQHGLGAIALEPAEPAAAAFLGERHLGAVAEEIIECPAQRVAQGADQDGRPEHVGIGLDHGKHGRLGAERQQCGGYEADDEDGGQADAGCGDEVQQPLDGGFDHKLERW